MATYVVPQVLVFQELQLVPQADVRPLPAHISGGHAYLIRYDEADEQAEGQLGYYNNDADECFEWPNRPAGGKVDSAYTKVFVKDGLLQYYEDFIGSGDTIETVATEKNQIRADATVFQTANGTARSAAFKERDVTVGDIAKVRAVVGADTYTLWTYVAGFVAEAVAAVVAAAASDADNHITQSAPSVITDYIGPTELLNCVDITATDQSLYNGLADGDINETYTVVVLESSAGNDATTAKLQVISASGNDDVAEVTPSAFGSPTAIGTRGLTVTWNDTDTAECSISASENEVANFDFIAGQKWRVSCGQAFTAPTATSGGTYTGPEDATYVIEVTKGGLYADSPEITVTTNKGIDASGPTVVSAASTAVAVGVYGVTVSFDSTGLRKGDRYTIAASAEGEGAVKTIQLGHNLAEEVQANGTTEVDLTLFIKKSFEVSEQRANTPGVTNWNQSSTEICLESGITGLDATWTDGGVPEALPLISESSKEYGLMFVEARYWQQTLCAGVESIFDVAQIDDAISGPLHPDNPLKWAVFKALQNSAQENNNITPVAYTSVCDPNDTDQWVTVLDLIDGRDDVYGLVPLTRDKTVWDLFQAHVSTQSTPEFGRWRVLWTNLAGVPTKVISDASTSDDGELLLATLEDDPNTSGTQYTLLTVPAGNSQFVADGVRAGDIVRYLYTTDSAGNTVYTEFVVDAVINETTIRLVSPGHTAAINTPTKMEVWRNLTATEQANELALTDGYSDRRVRSVWPDEITSGGITMEGYHLCAALAALSGGVVPQQGLTNLEINGFDDVSRTVDIFNRTQLNIMAGGGVWIVTQDLQTGDVFTRHAVTTGDTDDINEREEMLTRNLDSVSYFFLDLLSPYIGISNVTTSTITVLRSEIRAGIQVLRSRNFIERLGGQIIDATIRELRPHTTLKDRVVCVLDLTMPYALNNLEMHLVV